MSKTVLITGCSSGFGKLAAKTFQQNGWNVIATMRKPENEKELGQLSNTMVTQLDVTDRQSVQSAVGQGLERFGQIDVLVNNAGYGGHGLFEQASDEFVRKMFDTNLFGCMNTMRAVLPHMRERGTGTIINVTSMAALMPVPGSTVYSSSKYAIGGLTEAMALECKSFGVDIKLVEPGAFMTTEFMANLDNCADDKDPQLAARLTALNEHFAAVIESQSSGPQDPQIVADVIYRCATEETPIHNPAGADAEMLTGMIDRADSRQAFIEQVSPMLIPQA